MSASSGLGGEVLNVDQIAIHLARNVGLLFGSGSNQHVAIVDFSNALRNALQRLTSGLSQGLSIAGKGTAVAHGPHSLIGTGLHAAYHGFDFTCGRLSTSGKRTYFVGHHGKAAALFTGARSLDGGVEGQQVGLFGDTTNHVQHLTNLTNPPGKLFNH